MPNQDLGKPIIKEKTKEAAINSSATKVTNTASIDANGTSLQKSPVP